MNRMATLGAAMALLCAGVSSAETVVPPPESEHVDFTLDFGRLRLEPLVLIQLQAAAFTGADSFFQAGEPAEQPGFRLRRGRLGFRGTLYDYIPFAISTELVSDEGATARLLDAWVGYDRVEWLQLRAGAHVVPFGRVQQLGAGDVALIERPLTVRAMSPGRQVGAQLLGSAFSGALQYHVGVFNGFQRNEHFYQGYQDNAAAFGNRFDDAAYVVRLASDVLGPMDDGVQDLLGFGAQNTPRLSLGASYFFSDGGARDVHSAGGDLLFKWMGVHLLGEVVWSQSSPENQPTESTTQISEITSLGAVAELGYTLRLRDYTRVLSHIGVHGRFEWLDSNSDIDDEGDAWVAAAGVSFHFIENALKAQVDYQHREERHGVSLDNDWVLFQLGLNLGGLP
jgi:hypothetical protein